MERAAAGRLTDPRSISQYASRGEVGKDVILYCLYGFCFCYSYNIVSTPNRPADPFKVDDPDAALRGFEDFTRRILAVPKSAIDKKLAVEKAKRRRKNTTTR